MGPSFHLRMPPAWFFKFPPDPAPLALPPPTNARTFASPFAIDAKLYNDVLDWKVPVTIGAIYASTAVLMNQINRQRGNKPWAFSKTRPFKAFVIAHNMLLAVFSLLTFIGMIRALAHTWPAHRERTFLGKFWPGLRTENGLPGAADALCKMHGPRGFGDAAHYVPTQDIWETKNTLVRLNSAGLPDSMDVGRLWNEGLAFWGWWFYLSKFYEVLDTFIILAKGKRSSTLQTYHHTGAMMCMWAGIRYMSPPIWMFAFLNSGIHAMMYVYYTISALNIKVPQRVKRTLTTLQISQFIIGITFAALHLFVTYTVPVSVPYQVTHSITSAASAASSAVSSAASAAATAGLAAWLKKAAFRAAGEEGLAENVHNSKGELFGPEARAPALNRGETLFRTQYEMVPCIDTSGQAFAVWLNLAYLAPLTGLFVRFFIRSYSRRGAGAKHANTRRKPGKAVQDAAHSVEREIESVGKSAETSLGDAANNIKHVVSNNTPKSIDKRRVSATIEKQWERFETGVEDTITDVKDAIKRNGSLKTPSLKKKPSETHDNLRSKFENGETGNKSVDSPASDGAQKTKQSAEANKENSNSYAAETLERLEETAEASVQKTKEAVGMMREQVADVADPENYKSMADHVAERARDVKESPQSEDVKEQKSEGAKEETEEQTSQSSDSIPGETPDSPSLSRETSSQSQPSEQQPRSRSPHKSKIPQPTTQHSRSPTKKQPRKLATANRPQSRGPTPTTNGTKPQQNSNDNKASPIDDSGVLVARPSSQSKSSSEEMETNSNVTKQARSSSVTSTNQDAEGKESGENGFDLKESPSKSVDGLSSTDPKDDGATFAEKVVQAG